jgi:predicted nucleotidyltransferase
MIDLEPVHAASVKSILQKYVPECEVRAFGSRVEGKSSRYSDLDLALLAGDELTDHSLETLKDAFAESELPFQVDVLDWHRLADGFREIIEKRYEVVQKGSALSR